MKYGPVIIYKKIGQTPLMALEALRLEHPEWVGLPMTYAGRLDPVAEGVLLVLVGEDCKEKDKYLGLTKEYELSILFGFDTDTYDLLGEVRGVYNATPELLSKSTSGSTTVIKKFIGDINQSYPPYSSRTVDGKPLFQIARDGEIDDIKIPEHVVHIESIEIIENKNISKEDLRDHINGLINIVKGDFRQDDIKKRWLESLDSSNTPEYPVVKLKVKCGSGAYMRVLARDIGIELGLPALAYHIKRTKVGDFEIKKEPR